MAKLKPRPEFEGSLPGVLFGADSTHAPDSKPDWPPPEEWPRNDRASSIPPLASAEPLPRLVSSGTYDVAIELGGGAMATVYMAVKSGSNGFKKIVALKRIHKHLAGNSQFVDMLVDEARLASRISHPNVCQVLDFGCDDSGYYIALEFLSGQTLHAVFEALLLNPEVVTRSRHQLIASRIIASLAQGLHAAHCLKGDDGLPLEVVHRDVTPHNLFLLYDGVPKVTDFGVARARSRLHHTVDGTLKGKLAYMAPEQISRGEIDRRVDVFALGVVLWELLTGRRLFDFETQSETLAAICAGEFQKPSAVQPGISPKLDAIVLKALSVNEAERYQTARDFASALESFLSQSGDTVPQVDVVDWLSALFPGAEAHAESVQRQAIESPSKLSAQNIRLAPAASVAQLKNATQHVADDELWPMGDSSPPSRTARSVSSFPKLQANEPAPVPSSDPRIERAREREPAPRPRPFVPPAQLSEFPNDTSRTLGLAAVALIVIVAAGIIVLRHRAARLTAPPTVASAVVVTPPAASAAPLPAAVAATAPATSASASAPVASAAPVPAKPESEPSRWSSSAPKPTPEASAPETGSVFISTTGGAAVVMVNGSRVGQTPVLINLPPGHRTVTLVPVNGEPPREMSVNVTPNNTLMLNAQLNGPSAAPAAPAAPAGGTPTGTFPTAPAPAP